MPIAHFLFGIDAAKDQGIQIDPAEITIEKESQE